MTAHASQLTDVQRQQVKKQQKAMRHDHHEVDIPLSGHGELLHNFIVDLGVWNPAITSARYHASYLFYNNTRLFAGKTALDMGTGTGLMAVVMARGGAKHVVASDVSVPAVDNARHNVERFKLQRVVDVRHGDLFENVPEQFDCIVFNHPFFCGVPEAGDTITASMLAPDDLIHRFLEQADVHLSSNGVIMMPFYTKAGTANDPAVQGPKHGFDVTTCFRTLSRSGIQTGEIVIHELRRSTRRR